MPYNSDSSISCTIFPLNGDGPRLPAKEYRQHTIRSGGSPPTAQEIVTIESVTGGLFEVSVEIEPRSYSMMLNHFEDRAGTDILDEDHDYLIFVILDGVQVQRSKRHRSQQGPTRISCVFSDDCKSARPFQFGQLSLLDPDDLPSIREDSDSHLGFQVCENERVIESLGTIQVDVVRCCLGLPQPVEPIRSRRGSSFQSTHSQYRNRGDIKTSNQMKFSERTKKNLLSHTAGLGEFKPSPTHDRNYAGKKTARPVESKDSTPFLQFIFKYKSRALLEAEGIIQPVSQTNQNGSWLSLSNRTVHSVNSRSSRPSARTESIRLNADAEDRQVIDLTLDEADNSSSRHIRILSSSSQDHADEHRKSSTLKGTTASRAEPQSQNQYGMALNLTDASPSPKRRDDDDHDDYSIFSVDHDLEEVLMCETKKEELDTGRKVEKRKAKVNDKSPESKRPKVEEKEASPPCLPKRRRTTKSIARTPPLKAEVKDEGEVPPVVKTEDKPVIIDLTFVDSDSDIDISEEE